MKHTTFEAFCNIFHVTNFFLCNSYNIVSKNFNFMLKIFYVIYFWKTHYDKIQLKNSVKGYGVFWRQL